MRAYHAAVAEPALPAGHRFPIGKYRRLLEAAARRFADLRIEPGQPATEGELVLAHEPDWVSAVIGGTTSAAQQREIGFPWSPAMVERSRRSVGSTIAAARAALFGGDGVAANLAGGTHHACAHKGSGYCVFNDVAVAARLMQAEAHRVGRRSLRVWVIDLDVHQGNGTASIFGDDPTVFTLSLHGRHNFPFRKERSDLDVDLPDGCGDDEYLRSLDMALDRAWQRQSDHPPGLVFYLAGADPHENDRLGRLALTQQGLAERDRRVFERLSHWRLPAALAMAGGYNRDIDVTVAIHLQTLELALEHWRHWHRLVR